MRGHTVLLFAGEASGDAHAAAFARALRERRPELRIVGTGGPAMRSEGVELLAELDELAVMGFAEVVPRLAFFRRLERRVAGLIGDESVALVVLVDYPGFNMRVARAARERGRPVLYYVAPQVWAWRRGRARTLARITDRVAAILPFEVEHLCREGVRASFVGHPLLDRADEVSGGAELRARLDLAPDAPLLALLPGSRRQEISRHLDAFVEAARLVRSKHPDIVPVLSRAPGIPDELVTATGLPVADDTRALLRHAKAALVKSGTATLEAALERTPMVVAYRTSPLTWALAKRLVKVEHVSLPNLLLEERAVPELLQNDAEPATLAAALLPLMDDGGAERARQLAAFKRARVALGTPGAAGRVADIACELMDGGAA